MAALLRKYNTATTTGTNIRIPIVVHNAPDFATDSDWTPATGDVKLSQDGGAQSNISTLPSYANGAWVFQLTAAELLCKQLDIMIVDSASKAIEDQAVLVETFGDSSAMHEAATASEITDAVWNELQTGHVTVGTFGYYIDSQISAVSTTFNVSPVTSQILFDGSLTPKDLFAEQHFRYGPWAIGGLTDADGDDIDLTGKNVKFCMYSSHDPSTAIESHTVPSGSIVTNNVTVLFTPDDTTRYSQYLWKLYNITDNYTLAKGRVIIDAGPNPS